MIVLTVFRKLQRKWVSIRKVPNHLRCLKSRIRILVKSIIISHIESCSDLFVLSERKLQSNEYPHNLYVQNYSTASATCICLRKWIFLPEIEERLLSQPAALKLLFDQVKCRLLNHLPSTRYSDMLLRVWRRTTTFHGACWSHRIWDRSWRRWVKMKT